MKRLNYRVFTFKGEELCTLNKIAHEVGHNKDIDYAVYNIKSNKSLGFNLGDSTNIKLQDEVIIIGYPGYVKDDTPSIYSCTVSSITKYLGATLYTVDTQIRHGASGGVVLDKYDNVIGIIKAGVSDFEGDEYEGKCGFIPIHLALQHLESHMDA